MRLPRFYIAVALVLATVAGGCGLLDRIWGQIDFWNERLISAESIVDRAIIDIGADSANWKRAIQKAIDDAGDAHDEVRQDLEELMQRGISNAGLELRCDISYLADMLIQGLNGIKAELAGRSPPPITAFICDASPAFVDMNLDAGDRSNIVVFGYNLDAPGLQLHHIVTSGQQNRTQNFSLVSPFKRVVNLGQNGVILNQQSKLLRITLTEGATREIPVIQAIPPICAVRDHNTLSETVALIPTKIGRGDDEFSGHGPCIRSHVNVYADPTRTKVMARLDAQAWECPDDMSKIRSDYTQGSIVEERVLYTTEHNEEIVEIRTPRNADLAYIDKDTQRFTKVDTGLVAAWIIHGDTDGSDLGKTYVKVTLNSIHLVLRKNRDCVTEAELARMIAENAVSHRVKEYVLAEWPRVIEMARVRPASAAVRRLR